jgi:iron complex outermembrane receptor protein
VFPRAVLGAGPIQITEQNTGKLKLAYDFGQRARASYTIGLLHLKDNYYPQTYVRNAAGFPIFNTPNGVVNVSGLNFTGPSLNPGRVEYMHLMQGAELKTDTGGVFDLDLVASSYDILRDVGVDALRFGVDTSGRTREISGTGWKTADMRAIWRPEQDVLARHEISFGGHFDQYALKQYQDDTPVYGSSYSLQQFQRSVGKTRTLALYLQDVWSLAPDWKLTLGGRQEFWLAFEGANENRIGTAVNHDERSAAAFSPKAALSFRATPEVLLRGSYGNARRFPGVTELFQRTTSPTGVLINNPDLKPEQTDAYDVTAEYVFGGCAAHLSLFHEDRWNAIVFQQNVNVVPPVSSNQNVEKLSFNGVEGAVGLKDVLFDGFDVDANATYIDTQIVANSKFPVSVNKDVPLMPRWRAKIVGTYHPTDRLTLSAGLRYRSASYFLLDNSDFNHETWGGAGRAIIFDARATYKFAPNWMLSVGVNNLTRYKQWLFSPYPQRTFFAELHYDFD